MRNNRGFTLVESLVAIGLLSTVVTVTLPFYTLIMEQRLFLKQEREAFTIGNRVIHQFYENQQMKNQVMTKEETAYTITWEERERYLCVWIQWVDKKGNRRDVSLYAKG